MSLIVGEKVKSPKLHYKFVFEFSNSSKEILIDAKCYDLNAFVKFVEELKPGREQRRYSFETEYIYFYIPYSDETETMITWFKSCKITYFDKDGIEYNVTLEK